MARLKNRNVAIPNGICYRQPETKFQPPPWSSFDVQVQLVVAHRRANRFLADQHKWATDPDGVAAEVDRYLAQVCIERGWLKYVSLEGGESGEPLKKKASLSQKLGAVVAGAETIVEWLSSREQAVPHEQAETRAAVCVACPLHGKGGFEAYFTRRASAAVQYELQRRSEWKLATTHDAELNVCEACFCPLKLVVHCPLALKLAHMPKEAHDALAPGCWIRSEEATVKPDA